MEVDVEIQRHNDTPLNDDDCFSKVFDDQVTETIEFTGEIDITSQFSKYVISTPMNLAYIIFFL